MMAITINVICGRPRPNRLSDENAVQQTCSLGLWPNICNSFARAYAMGSFLYYVSPRRRVKLTTDCLGAL